MWLQRVGHDWVTEQQQRSWVGNSLVPVVWLLLMDCKVSASLVSDITVLVISVPCQALLTACGRFATSIISDTTSTSESHTASFEYGNQVWQLWGFITESILLCFLFWSLRRLWLSGLWGSSGAIGRPWINYIVSSSIFEITARQLCLKHSYIHYGPRWHGWLWYWCNLSLVSSGSKQVFFSSINEKISCI